MQESTLGKGVTMTVEGGLPHALPSPPNVVRDLGEFTDPAGQTTRQWIVTGADTDASLHWLLHQMEQRGWTVVASHLLLLEDLIVDARATTYPRGIGFDGVHNLRLTVVDLAPRHGRTPEPSRRHRRHLHRPHERRAHR